MINLYKKFLAILTVGALLGTSGVAMATTIFGSPSETDPYCEKTRNGAPRDYNGLGWFPPYPIVADGSSPVFVCEGEHWDGQDTVAPGSSNSGECTGATPDVTGNRYHAAVRQCADPGRMDTFNALNLVGVRASAVSDGGSSGAAYAFVRIGGVGTVGLFAAGCEKATNPASQMYGFYDGAHGCQGSTGHGAAGVYLQDDTPFGLNVLAGVVSALRITKGYASEGDCSQAKYEESAQNVAAQKPPTCGRDNTAVTVELLA